MTTKISIAMATYNGAAFLRTQLDSIASQTVLPDELVITDDCSTDDTLTIAQEFSKNAGFNVRWSRNEEQLGYSRNFNRALMKTTGDIVFLCDQDDFWFPEKVETITSILQSDTNTLLAINNAELTDEDLNPVGLTKLGQIRSAGLDKSDFVMGCCVAVKRDFLELCLPIPEGGGSHDSWLVTIADEMRRKRIVDIVLQYYRRHESSTIQTVVNTPKPATRLRARAEALERVWLGGEERATQVTTKKALILSSCESSIGLLDGKYDKDLNAIRDKVSKEISILHSREALRSMPRLRRLSMLPKSWTECGYNDAGGLKALLRDLLT